MKNHTPNKASPRPLRLGSILRAKCPRCHQGRILHKIFGVVPRCENCNLDFYPENGFYLGAMVVGYFLSAVLTVPPLIILKLAGASMDTLIIFPFVELLFVGSLLLIYSKVFWLHLEYTISGRRE